VLDLARDLGVEQRRIEGFDARDAAAAGEKGLPGLLGGITDSGQKTDARNYDSAGNKKLSFLDYPARRKTADRAICRPSSMPETEKGMPARGLFFLVFDVGDGVADRGDLFGVLVGDFQFESFFEGHDEFDNVQGVGAEVVDERCLVIHLAFVHAQLFDDDLLDLLFYC
jgi:hypothetical protein